MRLLQKLFWSLLHIPRTINPKNLNLLCRKHLCNGLNMRALHKSFRQRGTYLFRLNRPFIFHKLSWSLLHIPRTINPKNLNFLCRKHLCNGLNMKFIAIAIATLTVLSSCMEKSDKTPARAENSSITWADEGRSKEIKKIIEGFGVQILFDARASDIDAFEQLDMQLKRYMGTTTQKKQLEKLRMSYGNSSRTFFDHDLSIDPMPHADLVLLWDVLNTMPPSEIRSAFYFIKKSGARFILLAHDPELTKNHKSKNGLWQPINWQLAPHGFPKPLIEINRPNQRSLALWSCADVP